MRNVWVHSEILFADFSILANLFWNSRHVRLLGFYVKWNKSLSLYCPEWTLEGFIFINHAIQKSFHIKPRSCRHINKWIWCCSHLKMLMLVFVRWDGVNQKCRWRSDSQIVSSVFIYSLHRETHFGSDYITTLLQYNAALLFIEKRSF